MRSRVEFIAKIADQWAYIETATGRVCRIVSMLTPHNQWEPQKVFVRFRDDDTDRIELVAEDLQRVQ